MLTRNNKKIPIVSDTTGLEIVAPTTTINNTVVAAGAINHFGVHNVINW
jgi:hypothetical protein